MGSFGPQNIDFRKPLAHHPFAKDLVVACIPGALSWGLTGMAKTFDLSGFNNHAIVNPLSGDGGTGLMSSSGDTTQSADGFGQLIPSFDAGTTVYGRITATPKLDFTTGTPFTASIWINGAVAGGSGGAGFSQFDNSPSNFSGWMIWLADSTSCRLYMNGGTRATGTHSGVGWNLISVTWDTVSALVYVNGELSGSGAYSTAPAATSDLIVGGYYNSGDDDGGLTDQGIRRPWGSHFIWRRALSATEHRAFYQESIKGYPNLLSRAQSPVGMSIAAPAGGNPWYYYATQRAAV
jgi:hypothetical protein